MLKEVGASGQISLGKRFAGQLFEVTFHSDGRVEMLPMQAVPVRRAGVAGDLIAPDAWLPPGGYTACSAWALENRLALEAYSPWALQRGRGGRGGRGCQRLRSGRPGGVQRQACRSCERRDQRVAGGAAYAAVAP